MERKCERGVAISVYQDKTDTWIEVGFSPLPLLYSLTNSIHNNVFLNLRGRSAKDWAVVSPDASIGDDGADLGDAMFQLQSLHGIQRVFFHRAVKFDGD